MMHKNDARREAALPQGRGSARELLAWTVTVLLVAVALWLIHSLYMREMDEPWTRDGQVQADLILIASPVDGVVESVAVRSGSEVTEGGALFTVRPLKGADEHGHRMPVEEVRSPAQGWVIESSLQRGSAVKAGEPLFSVAVRESFRVTGFFRETLIGHIREGARARVTLMAWPDRPLDGVVESVGRGIERDDGALGPGLLPRVTPTFDWIRLAQRFPVRVKLDTLPPDVELRVGLTATVQILD